MHVASVSASFRHGSTTLRPQVCSTSVSVSVERTMPTFSATMIGQLYGYPACRWHGLPRRIARRAHGLVHRPAPSDRPRAAVNAQARVVDEFPARDIAERA